MIEALLNGKLSREQENMEDVLTSNIFGLLKYMDPVKGLLPFFAMARSISGEMLFSEVPIVESVEYEFWPWWQDDGCIGCEPDVVITLKRAQEKDIVVLVEAK